MKYDPLFCSQTVSSRNKQIKFIYYLCLRVLYGCIFQITLLPIANISSTPFSPIHYQTCIRSITSTPQTINRLIVHYALSQ